MGGNTEPRESTEERERPIGINVYDKFIFPSDLWDTLSIATADLPVSTITDS